MKDIIEIGIFNNKNSERYIQIIYFGEDGHLYDEKLDTKKGIGEIINYINENDILSIDELLDTVSFYDYNASDDGFIKLDKGSALDSYAEFLNAIMREKTDHTEEEKGNNDNLELSEINYYKYGNEYLARFVYSDGSYKLLGLHDANNLFEELINDGKIDRDFVDNNLHFYRTVDDNNYIEVDFDDYKSKYTTLDIKNVVLNHVEDGMDYITIVYNNGETENAFVNTLDDIINEYSKLTGLSVADLFDNNFVVENYIESINAEEESEDEVTKSDEETKNSTKQEKQSIFTRIKNFFRRNKDDELEDEEELEEVPKKTIVGRIKNFICRHPKAIALALAGVIGFIGFKIYNYFNPSWSTNISSETANDDEFADENYHTIIKESKNTERVKALSKVHDYMIKHYVKGIENRDANIEYKPYANDIMAYYLAYNDLDQKIIDKIYGSEDMDYEGMRIAIKNLVKQDAIDHTMQKNGLGKEIILNNDEAIELYNKYESIFIKINKTDDETKKIELLHKFYNKVRKDLPNMTSSVALTPSDVPSYDGVEDYMYMIREFYLAADKYDFDVDNSLTSDEKKYIDGIFDSIIVPKLIDIVDNHNKNNSYKKSLGGPSYVLFIEKVQDDYISKFNNLYIPDEEDVVDDEELLNDTLDNVITTDVNNNTNNVVASNYITGYSGYTAPATISSSQNVVSIPTSTASVENTDSEEENIFDKGYNKQKDSNKNSSKKKKIKDVKVKKNSSKNKDVEDIEDIEDVETIDDTADTSDYVVDIDDVSDIVDDVADDISVQDVQISDVTIDDTKTVEDVVIVDVPTEDVVSDIEGVDVETIETVDDVVFDVNDGEDVYIIDTVVDDDSVSDVDVSDIVVDDTTDVTEDVVEDIPDSLDVEAEDEDVTYVEDTEHELSAEEIADTIVEVMASEDVEDIEMEDDYQYTR